MSIENLSFSLGFLINILKSITIITTSNIITIILNTDTPVTRPVDPVCESLDDVIDELIIIVTGGDLSLSYSTLLIVKTQYT